jgi:hypothetical protein
MSSYIPIASITSSGNTITFSSIPTTLNGKTLRDLILIADIGGNDEVIIRFNDDTSNTYSWVRMRGDGSDASSLTSNVDSYIDPNLNLSVGGRAVIQMNVMDFSQTNKHKSVLLRVSHPSARVNAVAGRYPSTSAINSLTIKAFQSFGSINGTFSLYGIEG